MTEEQLQALAKVGQSVSSVLNSIGTMNAAESKIIAAQNQLEYTTKVKEVAQNNRNNFQLMKENLSDRREENEVSIAALIEEIGSWNINASEWSTLDDPYQTLEGKDILKELGIEYGEDFRFKEQFALDSKTQFNNTQNLIRLQDVIINDLTNKKNEILGLQKDWINVGTGAGMKKWKDLEDIKEYMWENKDKFGIREGIDTIEQMDWAKDTNQLAKAFMKQKEGGTGFWEYPSTPEMKALKLSTKAGTYGIPEEEVLEKDTQMNLNTHFNTIKETIGNIKAAHSDDPETGIKYSAFLDDLDLENFLTLKGSQKLWDKDPYTLKANLEGKILALVNAGTTWRLPGMRTPKVHENVRAIAQLTNMQDNPLTTDIDESEFTLASQPLNRYKGVSNLYERWIGGDIKVKGTDTYGKEVPMWLPKTKVGGAPGIGASGLFNLEYAQDEMYLEDYPIGGKFGTTPEDKLVYDLLSMWKVVDTYAPTDIPDILK